MLLAVHQDLGVMCFCSVSSVILHHKISDLNYNKVQHYILKKFNAKLVTYNTGHAYIYNP